MKNTSKTTQAPEAPQVIPTAQAPEAPQVILTAQAPEAPQVIPTAQAPEAPQVIPTAQAPEAPQVILIAQAPEEPQALPAPPTEGPQMEDVVAEEEQALPAQDESSGSSAPRQWEEPEDPHPPEKRPRRSSPDYDPAEEVLKTYQRRHKRTHRVVHSVQPESQPSTGPSEYEPEPQVKKGCRNKMPTGLHVVEEINANGVPVQPEAVQRKAKTACGCLARQAIRIIHDDWRKVLEEDKNYIWDN